MFFLCFYRLLTTVWRGWPNQKGKSENRQKSGISLTRRIGQKRGCFEVKNGKKKRAFDEVVIFLSGSFLSKKRGKQTLFRGKIGEEKG